MLLNINVVEKDNTAVFDFPTNMSVHVAAWMVAKHFNMHGDSVIGNWTFGVVSGQGEDEQVENIEDQALSSFEEQSRFRLIDLR